MAISCGKCILTDHVYTVMSFFFPQRSARVNARSSSLHVEVPWLKGLGPHQPVLGEKFGLSIKNSS